MIRSFRAFFLGRLPREKILLAAFGAILVFLAFSRFSDQVGRFWRATRQTGNELALQAQWLANRKEILESAQKSASSFDAASTLNSAGLLAAVQQMAIDAGMSNTHGDLDPDVSSGRFAVHTLQFNIPKTDWTSLTAFYVALRKRHPYIGIEQFDIRNPPNGTLGASMKLSSVEIVGD